mmetsp:Transcript_101102/g.285045  ORF Transcript_101102/g.285045 Transcript_101102/m.285045 type:complete len:159 (+) Transcript_101102:112-588(+)
MVQSPWQLRAVLAGTVLAVADASAPASALGQLRGAARLVVPQVAPFDATMDAAVRAAEQPLSEPPMTSIIVPASTPQSRPAAVTTNNVNVHIEGDYFSPPEVTQADKAWLAAVIKQETVMEDAWIKQQIGLTGQNTNRTFGDGVAGGNADAPAAAAQL